MKLLVASFPGWLSESLLESLARDPLPSVTSVRCMFLPKDIGTANEYLRQFAKSVVELEAVAADLTDRRSLDAAVADVDLVLHGAAIMHPKSASEYFDVNTRGTRAFAEAAANAGVRRFVFLSSNAAAGRSEDGALMEETSLAQPLSPYGLSKRLAEEWLMNTAGPMERVVLRPCMFYGPPVPPRHVDVYRRLISSFMPLVGGGAYKRSLVYIDNLVQAVRLALLHPAANRQTYFVADAEHYSTREVVDAMARALGVKPRYLRLPALSARVAYELDRLASIHGLYFQEMHLLGEADWNVGVSIDKARRELGYAPAVAIDDGMRSAVAWCRQRRLLG